MGMDLIPERFVVYRVIGNDSERYGIGVMEIAPQETLQVCEHHVYRIGLVINGYGKLQCGSESYFLSPGSVIHYFSELPFSMTVEPDYNYTECFIELGEAMVEMLKRSHCLSDVPVMQTQHLPLLLEQLLKLRNKFFNDEERELVSVLPEIMSFLLEIFHNCTFPRCSPVYRSAIEKGCKYLSSHFDEPEDLKGFCRKQGIGYENFRKLFKQETGLSPHQYRLRRRMERACVLLLLQSLSIAEISHQLGFCSTCEFSAQFHRTIGVSPVKYRKNRGII